MPVCRPRLCLSLYLSCLGLGQHGQLPSVQSSSLTDIFLKVQSIKKIYKASGVPSLTCNALCVCAHVYAVVLRVCVCVFKPMPYLAWFRDGQKGIRACHNPEGVRPGDPSIIRCLQTPETSHN